MPSDLTVWIPTTERLPDRGSVVWVTMELIDGSRASSEGYWFDGWHVGPGIRVVAWMPIALPEPWTGGRATRENRCEAIACLCREAGLDAEGTPDA
jgi:hypothetical protein